MREIIILGSTGSIGVQALEIVEANPDKFKVIAISAGSGNLPLLFEQAAKFAVPVVGTTADKSATAGFSTSARVITGAGASAEIAAMKCDVVLNGITGSIGLGPTLAALEAGNTLALANKESLVAGGDLVMRHGRDRILPVDSEHSALFQAMASGKHSEISQAILTASGGAFRDRENLNGVTVEEALNHPTWKMGPVVTINSATLVNKGLEIIEAHYLFDLPYSKISAVIHPQSYIHSMIEFVDGSTIAQLSPPNMKGPIGYALGYPHRISDVTPSVDWRNSHSWDFRPIDDQRFPAVSLARMAGERGAIATATFNASNEVAVDAFVAGKIAFTEILSVVERVLASGEFTGEPRDLSDVISVEQTARSRAGEIVAALAKR